MSFLVRTGLENGIPIGVTLSIVQIPTYARKRWSGGFALMGTLMIIHEKGCTFKISQHTAYINK